MVGSRVAFFGRVNRRHNEMLAQLVADRDFNADLQQLVESQTTQAEARGRTWSAGDLDFDPSGTFLTGILGYEGDERFVAFDSESFSWSKGETSDVVGATRDTMVPFAIDARNDRRYVAFTTTRRIKPQTFCEALSAVLTSASQSEGWEGLVWEVDLISDTTLLEEFLVENPQLTRVQRTVRRPNPRGEYLDADLERMNALFARTMSEDYRIRPNTTLTKAGAEIVRAGLEEGFTEVRLEAQKNGVKVEFDSRKRRRRTVIGSFGSQLRELGGELLSGALKSLPGGSPPPEQGELLEPSEGSSTPG